MFTNKSISKIELYLRKAIGCYTEFGIIEATRRAFQEIIRFLKKTESTLDISFITENLAIGAAPSSVEALMMLKNFGYRHVIDLRAERKNSDLLAYTKEVSVSWIPTYDDWRPKPAGFFRQLALTIEGILSSKDSGGLYLCCGAGEHRAPIAGALALVTMGYPLAVALEKVQKARPTAEILPTYESSLAEFLRENGDGIGY